MSDGPEQLQLKSFFFNKQNHVVLFQAPGNVILSHINNSHNSHIVNHRTPNILMHIETSLCTQTFVDSSNLKPMGLVTSAKLQTGFSDRFTLSQVKTICTSLNNDTSKRKLEIWFKLVSALV